LQLSGQRATGRARPRSSGDWRVWTPSAGQRRLPRAGCDAGAGPWVLSAPSCSMGSCTGRVISTSGTRWWRAGRCLAAGSASIRELAW